MQRTLLARMQLHAFQCNPRKYPEAQVNLLLPHVAAAQGYGTSNGMQSNRGSH